MTITTTSYAASISKTSRQITMAGTKKSRVRETSNLSTNVDRSTDTTKTKNTQKPQKILKTEK